jgi:hypothetical protein
VTYDRRVANRDIAVVVGNGMTIDLCRGYGASALSEWDTSAPLGWSVRTPGEPDLMIDRLPRLREAIATERAKGLDNDFKIIDEIARRYAEGLEGGFELDCELRHYLALAYSEFQTVVDSVELSGWHWVEFLRAHADRIAGAFSFNYDLVLESALAAAGLPYMRAVQNENSGTPLVKPHGSADFEYVGVQIPTGYPLSGWAGNNNTPAMALPRDKLLTARMGPELVAPLQGSHIRQFQWVATGFNWFRAIGTNLTSCMLVGLSYWPVDRPEINEILDSLATETEVVVVNPAPPNDLLDAIRARGLPHLVTSAPP